MKKTSELLKGAIDLHVHSGPGPMPRSLDHVEAAKQCIEAGMRGLILKDHYSMTCNLAHFFNKYTFKDLPVEVFGGLALNNQSGGISPSVVDNAIKYGAKIIWMPTVSARNHIEAHKHEESVFSSQEESAIEEIPLTVLDNKGNLLPQISQICQLIAKADIILATGHLHLNEIKVLVDEAIRLGVKKILVNHPEFLVGASIDDMIDLASKGVFIEHSYTLTISKKLTKEYLFEMIRKVGAEHTIVGSDLGQVGRPSPVEGLDSFIQDMLQMGMKDEEIDLLLRVNPAKLLNLD
ncbi:DUF6282 family protein [Chloroflexota bacterium]